MSCPAFEQFARDLRATKQHRKLYALLYDVLLFDTPRECSLDALCAALRWHKPNASRVRRDLTRWGYLLEHPRATTGTGCAKRYTLAFRLPAAKAA